MHDWQEVVRRKLASERMSRSQRDDVVAELADHLEDFHAELLASGLTEPEASTKCLEQLSNLQQIAIAAQRSHVLEGAMNRRSKTFWLPGLVTLTLASVSLMLMQLFTFSRPRVHWVDGGAVAMGYVWLVSLLPCGALGAYLSRRAGGTRLSSIIASLFPSLTMLAVFSIILPVGIFIERNTYIIHHLGYFGLGLLVWIVVPGAALLLGALPILWRTNSRVQTGATPHVV